jgi:hypothetical protein
MGDETRELTDREREADENIQKLVDYLGMLRPQKRKQMIAVLFGGIPDAVVMDLQRAFRLGGAEGRIIAYIKELRQKAADSALSKQERNDAAWELKDLGFDDESLRTDDRPDEAD